MPINCFATVITLAYADPGCSEPKVNASVQLMCFGASL